MSSPASVSSSADPSSQLAPQEGPAPVQEDIKMELKKQEEEEEEGDETQGDGKSLGKTGKVEPDEKAEEKLGVSKDCPSAQQRLQHDKCSPPVGFF